MLNSNALIFILVLAILSSATAFIHTGTVTSSAKHPVEIGGKYPRPLLPSTSLHDKHRYSAETETVLYRSREKENPTATPGSVISLDLPKLTASDLAMLQAGERVQKQRRNGRAGTGWVVVDVDAAPDVVFEGLSAFDSYEEMIPTVRGVDTYYKSADICKAEFSLSKFRLKINAEHKVYPEQQLIRFKLDSERPNLVLRQATGFWLVEPHPDRDTSSRVWLSARIVASRVVPTLVVDYAACRALPRATSWIQPHFARVQQRRKH
mmetsp:Transcript_3296/g.5135  ORF Transcript_3296/g.5135 Transcript_3296/m.5135 type:complete len:265 (+) Transcript_3296:198-992(+)